MRLSRESEIVQKSPLIIAHRGDSAYAPENTMAAFKMAFDKGANGIEFDVRLSKDGKPVVIHDRNLKRTANRAGRIADLTAKELADIDVGSWFNTKNPKRSSAKFPSETVPELSQVLKLAQEFSGPIYVELKCGDLDYAALARAVCEQIHDSAALSRVIIKSFTLAAIPVVRSYLPEVQTAALFAPETMTFIRKKKYIIDVARAFGAHQISVHHSLATRHLTSLARNADMPVTVWTADEVKWVSRCRKLGITALITNNPGKLLAA